MYQRVFLYILTGFAFLFHSCKNKAVKDARNELFLRSDSLIIPEFSDLFILGINKTDTLLWLRDPSDTSKTLGAFVWGRGTDSYSHFNRINTRKQFVLTSAVFAGMMESLHAQNKISGIDNGDFLTSPKTRKLFKAGKISEIAKTGEINAEAIARLNPGCVIGYFIEPKGREHLLRVQTSERPVLFFQNFLEKHPLGRAEWILVFGYLCGKADDATRQFDEIKEHYLTTAEKANEAKTRPVVLVNAPFSGAWDIPAGESYMAELIYDAGGKYPWASITGSGRIPLDLEKVYTSAGQADFWLNPGACRNVKCLIGIDPRVQNFKAFKIRNLYNCTRTMNENGANAYWEYGVIRPDLVLKDLLSILHPDLAPEHELVFYEKLKSE